MGLEFIGDRERERFKKLLVFVNFMAEYLSYYEFIYSTLNILIRVYKIHFN